MEDRSTVEWKLSERPSTPLAESVLLSSLRDSVIGFGWNSLRSLTLFAELPDSHYVMQSP